MFQSTLPYMQTHGKHPVYFPWHCRGLIFFFFSFLGNYYELSLQIPFNPVCKRNFILNSELIHTQFILNSYSIYTQFLQPFFFLFLPNLKTLSPADINEALSYIFLCFQHCYTCNWYNLSSFIWNSENIVTTTLIMQSY